MTRAVRSMGIALMMILSSLLLVGVIAQDNNMLPDANVHGMVIDSRTGEPMHALIYIIGRQLDAVRTIETERDGMFNLYLPAGEYVWEAEAEGYQAGRGEFRVGDGQLSIDIVMEPIVDDVPDDPEGPPEYNVAGMLVDANTGNGVPGYIGFGNPDGKGTQIETDESGHFTILLPPGPWIWKAGARGYKVADGRLLMGEEPQRLMIKLTPLENEEPEPPERSYGIVYGHVMSPEGIPIAGANVFLHPLMRDMPMEDPNLPRSTDDLTAAGVDPDGQRTRGETDAAMSITFREFFAKFSEKFDEQTLKRIFTAADANGDGVLNDREFLRARTLISEMGTPEDPGVSDRVPLEAVTDENGMFKLRVPFGAYMIEVNAREFLPGQMDVRVIPDRPEQKVEIILEPMMDQPDRDLGRMKVRFSMVDRNSDGNPEKVDLMADLNGDGVFEVQYHMVDRSSDGNPESVEWVLNIPMEMWEKVMGMIMMFIQTNQGGWDGMPPMPDDAGNWVEGEWTDDGLPFDPTLLEELLGQKDGDTVDEDVPAETDDIDNGDVDPSTVSDKEAAASAGAPVFEVIAAVGILLLILAGILGIGLFIRRKKN